MKEKEYKTGSITVLCRQCYLPDGDGWTELFPGQSYYRKTAPDLTYKGDFYLDPKIRHFY